MDRERLFSLMRRQGLDAVVAVSPENVHYLSGTKIETQVSIRDRLGLVVWPLDAEPTMIVCNLEEAQARDESWIRDIRAYFEFKTLPVELLASTLRERGLSGRRVGIELGYLTARDYTALLRLQPGLEPADCSRLLEHVRMVKSPEEVEVMSRAAYATDVVIRKTFENIKVGKSEKQIATELQVNLIEAGADSQVFSVLTIGDHGCLTHPAATGRPAKAGEIIRTDFGGSFRGYNSDLARTCVVHRPLKRQLEIYKWLWEFHEKIIAEVAPGVRVAHLFELCQKLFVGRGLPFVRPHIGHGLGLAVHEEPIINPYTDILLEPNMIICIEPNYEVTGVEKYHVEDTILVTETGHKILSRSADWSDLLVAG